MRQLHEATNACAANCERNDNIANWLQRFARERPKALTWNRDTNDNHTNDGLRATKQFDCARDGHFNCGTKTTLLQRPLMFTHANGPSCFLRVRPYLTTSARAQQ